MMTMTTMIRVWWVSQGRGHTCLPHRSHTPVTSASLHPHRVSCFLSVKIISTGSCDLCVVFTGVVWRPITEQQVDGSVTDISSACV